MNFRSRTDGHSGPTAATQRRRPNIPETGPHRANHQQNQSLQPRQHAKTPNQPVGPGILLHAASLVRTPTQPQNLHLPPDSRSHRRQKTAGAFRIRIRT